MNEIRIIGGKWKRTKLVVKSDGPDSKVLRPTPSRVRETLFNWLGFDLVNKTVLDAFAGTGVLGLESASRGAKEVYMVEKSSIFFHQIQLICNRLGATEIVVFCADIFQLHKPEWQEKFDVVFLDPPFASSYRQASLKLGSIMVKNNGFVYFETNKALILEEITPYNLRFYKQYKAGMVLAYLLVKNGVD